MTSSSPYRPGAAVLVSGIVDRVLRADDQGSDTIRVRVANPLATGRHDADVVVNVQPTDVAPLAELAAVLTKVLQVLALGDHADAEPVLTDEELDLLRSLADG